MVSVSSICLTLCRCDLVGLNVHLVVHFCFNPSFPSCTWFNAYTVAWFEWYQFLLSLSVTFWAPNGSKSLVGVGSRVFVLRPNKRCAGDVPMPSVGMLQKSSNARYGSVPDSTALLMMLFTVLTAFFALPFDCG